MDWRTKYLNDVNFPPWTSRRSNQSILKEISPEYSLEGLPLKLKVKLQYFGRLNQRTDPLKKTLMLGKIEGRRRRVDKGWDAWMASLTRWTWVWASAGKWSRTGKPGQLQSRSVQFSCSVMSDSLWPHEAQHTRPPCPSPTPRIHLDSCSPRGYKELDTTEWLKTTMMLSCCFLQDSR